MRSASSRVDAAVQSDDHDHQRTPGHAPARRAPRPATPAALSRAIHASYRRRAVGVRLLGRLELHARRPRRRRARRRRSGSVEHALVAADEQRRRAFGRQHAQRVVEAAHAPAVDRDAARRRAPGRPARPAPPRSTWVTLTPVSALSLTRTPRRCASVAGCASISTPKRCSSARQRQLVGAVHPGRELARVRAAADRLERGGDVGFVDRAAAARLPEQAHHVVERALAFAAQASGRARARPASPWRSS